MLNFIVEKKIEILLFLLMIFALSSALILNDVLIHIRMKELAINLQRADKRENELDHVRLVLSYNVNRRLYQEEISEDEVDIINHTVERIQTKKEYENITVAKYRHFVKPGLLVINTIRTITGRVPVIDISEDTSVANYEIGYYYERNKLYQDAITWYRKSLEDVNLNSELVGSINLHIGYSYAMLGENNKARENYKKVIQLFKGKPIAITASILLQYLDEFEKEKERILASSKQDIDSAEKLFRLFAFNESTKLLDTLEKEASPEEKNRIQYYKARCFEELGDNEKAVSLYLDVISESEAESWARYSTRRLYMIGSRGTENREVKDIAVKINTKLKDPTLSTMIIEESKSSSLENSIADNTLFQNVKTEKLTPIKTISIDEKKVDTVIKHVEEVTRPKPKPKPAAETGGVKKVYTTDGSIFVGKIRRQGDNYFIQTSIGEIAVPRSKIARIENN
jgi:tetratricopeptide (TPR) repeat protein